MIVGIHNVNPDNDNRAARFAEMQKEVGTMQTAVTNLLKSGAIDDIVKKAIRPLIAEIALQQKEIQQREAAQVNSQRKAAKYLLPKGD